MFKNQYILTDKNINPPSQSNYYRIGNYNLFTSKEIKVYTSKNKILTLIGYAFHCYNSNNEQEIIDYLSLLKNEDLLNEYDNLCGHFFLISNQKQLKIYPDACSSFKIFYAKSEKYTFIGSDPKILCNYHNFTFHINKEKTKFYQSKFFLKNNTKIGHHTRYKGMYQLISNYCLAVNELKSERVFPREIRKELSMQEASERLIPIFKNILNQIEKKYTIFTSITAGYDSRLLMSATKKHAKKITYYTFRLPNISKNSIDYTLPKKICSDLKLNYKSMDIPNLNKKEITKIQSIYDLPKTRPFQQYKNIFPEHKKPNILLVGFVSEIAKNYLERIKVKNGKDIVRAIHYPDNVYLSNYYQKWLNNNQQTVNSLGYETLDFIHWEQDISNFAGQNTHYAHHYVKLLSIFNSKEIIKIMLAVNHKERDGKDTKFFKYLIAKMWPELLNYDFNSTIKNKIIILLKKLKIYSFYKTIQINFFSNGKIS